jgi:hypothetical protein
MHYSALQRLYENPKFIKPSLDPTLYQFKAAPIVTPYLSNTYFNIISCSIQATQVFISFESTAKQYMKSNQEQPIIA